MSKPNKLIYGEGMLQTQQATTNDGDRCLTIRKLNEAKPINSTPDEWSREENEDQFAAILVFKNIEGARTLQDELNELISLWSKHES